MKYIRTKEGRIVKHPHSNADVFTFRHKILKQADTIEELCDEFVVVWKDYIKDTPYVIGFSAGKTLKELMQICVDNMNYEIEDIKECYGATWTDKGFSLIYVAKMNEKGKLELL